MARPQACEDCRRTIVGRTFILDIDPQEGLVERPIVEFMIGDIMRSIDDDVAKERRRISRLKDEGLGAVLLNEK